MALLTKKIIQDRLNKQYGKNVYVLKGEYLGQANKHTFKHNCGQTFDSLISNITRNPPVNRCPCLRARKNVNVFQTKLDAVYGPNVYVLQEEFKGRNHKHDFKHTVCGHIFNTTANTLLVQRVKCPCVPNKPMGKPIWTLEEAQKVLNKKLGNTDYKLVKYVKQNKKAQFIHKCGKKLSLVFSCIYNKDSKCPCLHTKQYYRTLEIHQKEVVKWRGHDWECLEFNGTKNKQNVYRHILCDTKIKTTLDSFKLSTNCFVCNPFTTKEVTINGRIFKCQGFEDKTLRLLVKKYKSKHIKTGMQPNRIKVTYLFEKKNRTYYPDFYIKTANLIVETKCLMTLGLSTGGGYFFEANLFKKNQAKAKKCIEMGYEFKLDLYSDDGKKHLKLPTHWMFMPKKKVLAHLQPQLE